MQSLELLQVKRSSAAANVAKAGARYHACGARSAGRAACICDSDPAKAYQPAASAIGAPLGDLASVPVRAAARGEPSPGAPDAPAPSPDIPPLPTEIVGPDDKSNGPCGLKSAEFTKLPDAYIETRPFGRTIVAEFYVEARFDYGVPCGCRMGQYRQYIKGEYIKNGKRIPLPLGNGQILSKDKFQEDCTRENGCYGHRKAIWRNWDGYYDRRGKADQSEGCIYKMGDVPHGIDLKSGDEFSMRLDFLGTLMDYSNATEITRKEWTVAGSIKKP